MAKIKICGLKRNEDIAYVNELKPDYIGFILSQGFRRSIAVEEARELKSMLGSGIKAVGVFVNEPIENVCLDFIVLVQLHGSESPEYCAKIEIPVIKELKPDMFDQIKDYEPYVDYFLFDAGCGEGKTFEWNRIPKTIKPFFLAGGLGTDNLREAIESINPYAVDMSSSVETDGTKGSNENLRVER